MFSSARLTGAQAGIGRRRFIRVTGWVAVAWLGRRTPLAFGAPKETGLSFEGLLKNLPGFQPRTLAKLPFKAIAGFLSERQLAINFAVYRDAFAKLTAVEAALADAPRDAAHAIGYAQLRSQQVMAANSVLLHEFYFRNLAAVAPAPGRYLLGNMAEHMGSLDNWREDFIACARVAEEWALLAYDPYDDRWHNVATSAANAGGWTGGNPLIVCDVANHAWAIDYQNRETYVASFLEHLDWAVIAARYRAVDRQ